MNKTYEDGKNKWLVTCHSFYMYYFYYFIANRNMVAFYFNVLVMLPHRVCIAEE